ncbi:MAG: hypothetical protein J2P19_23625 [Pseudonocardia sp.]|nr:hypothetical protein [Pseudonocardia sp.]
MSIKWGALGEVFLVGLGVTVAVVVLFALGVNALANRAGELGAGVDGSAGGRGAGGSTAVAVLCCGVCVLVVAYGIYLIVS